MNTLSMATSPEQQRDLERFYFHEARLLAQGFRKEGEAWLTAWDIVDTPAAERVNLIQEIFSDPEMIQTLMSAVQEIMKQIEPPAPNAAQ